MTTGPKYKICKRLGAAIFEKCQTNKYAIALSRRKSARGGRGRPKSLSDYGRQMLEKQKMRLMYGLRERQFANYIARASSKQGTATNEALYAAIESRLDNVVYRLGIAHTRALARQLVSHGHITVNGRKVTIPSYALSKGDCVGIREQSRGRTIFVGLQERLTEYTSPAWLSRDLKVLSGTVVGSPVYATGELLFDIQEIIEFYSR